MRLGLDLRSLATNELVEQAHQADHLGVWAVLVDSPLAAAELATSTKHVHLALFIDPTVEHALTLAEEVAVLDHLSARRMLAVVDSGRNNASTIGHDMRQLLGGHTVGDATLAPPPAQTAVTVWQSDDVPIVALTGTLADDQAVIDELHDKGHTHVFAKCSGSIESFARHLVTRALTPDFPQIVADYADMIAPLDPTAG